MRASQKKIKGALPPQAGQDRTRKTLAYVGQEKAGWQVETTIEPFARPIY
jgi:hypothetical protein